MSMFAIPWLVNKKHIFIVLLSIFIMVFAEWCNREKQHGLEISRLKPIYRVIIFVVIFEIIIFFLPTTPSQFIYFQF